MCILSSTTTLIILYVLDLRKKDTKKAKQVPIHIHKEGYDQESIPREELRRKASRLLNHAKMLKTTYVTRRVTTTLSVHKNGNQEIKKENLSQ